MQPSQLVARLNALLHPALGVEAARPIASALDERDELLTNVELGGNVFLHPTLCQLGKDAAIAVVKGVHPLSLSRDDAEREIGLLGLNRNEGPHCQQKALDIGRVGNGVAEEPPVTSLHSPAVFLDAPVTEARVHRVESRPEGVSEPQTDAALGLVDLNAAFPIEEAGDIAPEGIFAPVFHDYNLPQSRVANNFVVAVPVVHWIGERIAMVEALGARAEAA